MTTQLKRRDDLQLAVAQLCRKSRAQSAQLHLAGQFVAVIAGLPVREPCRRGARSGLRTEPIRARPVPFCFHSFLPEPGNFVAGLGLVSAGALAGQIMANRLVQQVFVDFGAKDRVGQFHFADFRIIQIDNINSWA